MLSVFSSYFCVKMGKMRKIHFVSGVEPLLFDIALAVREKEYDVSVSGINFTSEMIGRLKQSGCTYYGEGWFPEKLTKDIGVVVLGANVNNDNPELIKAKELGLLIQSIPEFVFQRVKQKTRVVVAGTKGKKTILSMISYVLLKQKVVFDYAFTNRVPVLPNLVKMGYESRIALIEGDELITSVLEKRVRMEFYRPHITVLTNITWEQSAEHSSLDSYLKIYKTFVDSIEREGKLIYFEGDEEVSRLAKGVRSDITAIPYGQHEVQVDEGGRSVLATRYGRFPIYIPDNYFLVNMNAARLVCRQLGVKDATFYQAISDYSLSLQA